MQYYIPTYIIFVSKSSLYTSFNISVICPNNSVIIRAFTSIKINEIESLRLYTTSAEYTQTIVIIYVNIYKRIHFLLFDARHTHTYVCKVYYISIIYEMYVIRHKIFKHKVMHYIVENISVFTHIYFNELIVCGAGLLQYSLSHKIRRE